MAQARAHVNASSRSFGMKAGGMSPEAKAVISESPTMSAFESLNKGHTGAGDGIGHGHLNTVSIVGTPLPTCKFHMHLSHSRGFRPAWRIPSRFTSNSQHVPAYAAMRLPWRRNKLCTPMAMEECMAMGVQGFFFQGV